MPYIPFPDVPVAPGVPQVTRSLESAIASNPALATALGTVSNLLAQTQQQNSKWGIFTLTGARVGQPVGSGSVFVDLAVTQLTGQQTARLTTVKFEFAKSTRVSGFPVEGGSFANYNKVETPALPTVTLALQGSEDDRTYFINSIDRACKSTDLYNVLTPEIQYLNYTLTDYRYSRSAYQGATLLITEIALSEVREVNASFTTASKTVDQVSNPSAASQVDAGKVQAPKSDTSTLKRFTQWLPGVVN